MGRQDLDIIMEEGMNGMLVLKHDDWHYLNVTSLKCGKEGNLNASLKLLRFNT